MLGQIRVTLIAANYPVLDYYDATNETQCSGLALLVPQYLADLSCFYGYIAVIMWI
jgi:hypothetical protein